MKPSAAGAPGAVDVVFTPGEVKHVELAGRLVVVMDVIRASTSILAALEAGGREVVPVATPADARAAAGSAEDLLCGERGGLRIEGFDLGNSPLEPVAQVVAGRRLLWTTTNGTRAILAAAGAAEVWLACFRNLEAVAERISVRGPPPILLCAGRGGRFAMDDALCAGHLVTRLQARGMEAKDGARAAAALVAGLGPPTPELLASTAAGRALVELGMERDVAYCAELDRSSAVPGLRDGVVVLVEGGGGC